MEQLRKAAAANQGETKYFMRGFKWKNLNSSKKTRTLLFVIFAFIGIFNLKAQTSFSCTYREYCSWNQRTETFENCSGYEESSLFVMNKDETMFTHTTESTKSTYYVSSKDYDEAKEIWTYDVTSDVGNKYTFVFDPRNKEIRALYYKDGDPVMIVFTVKAIF